jgi:hypothetical protein
MDAQTRKDLSSVNKIGLALLLNSTTGSRISGYRATTESLVRRIDEAFEIYRAVSLSDAEEKLIQTPGALGVQVWLPSARNNWLEVVTQFEVGPEVVRLVLTRR